MDDQSPINSNLPVSAKIPCVQSLFHLHAGTVRLKESNLYFQYSSLHEVRLTCSFFVYEDGLGYTADKKYALSPLTFQVPAGKLQSLSIPLNLSYTFEYSTSLPIVIEAHPPSQIQVSIIEIKNETAKVLQQRIILHNRIFEIKEIVNPPIEGMEERDKNCVICMSNPRNTIIEPCVHICICDYCANLMRAQVNRKCPMCRTGNSHIEVVSFTKINF